jgi:RND family efflux transporter MFP subunit
MTIHRPALPLLVASCALALLALAPEPTRYSCISRPSDYRDLGFSARGKIAELLVKPGERVEKNQPLVRLDDSAQKPIVEYMRLQSADQSALKLAQTNLAYRERELALIESTIAKDAGNNAQLREATFRRDAARLDVESATVQLKLRAAELAREDARLKEMAIVSPLSGVVLDVRKRPGEIVEENTAVVTVLSVDPLWLDVNVPTRDAAGVSVGQPAEVVWEDLEGAKPMTGKVIYKSPAGNAGARQIQVRVEVDNPAQIPSGLHGNVRFLGAGNPPAGPTPGRE